MLLFAGATDRADCLPCSQPFSLPHTLPETETKQRAVENRRTASSSNVELDCDGGEWQWKSTRNTRVFSVNMKCTNYIERERAAVVVVAAVDFATRSFWSRFFSFLCWCRLVSFICCSFVIVTFFFDSLFLRVCVSAIALLTLRLLLRPNLASIHCL